jgi:cyclopropane-fatty-acyl-phospholipid synthase
MPSNFRQTVDQLLEGTTVAINGQSPWDIKVKDDRLFGRVLSEGSLGFGEAYMEGWWDCDQIDEMITRIQRHDVVSKLKPSANLIRDSILARLVNLQSKNRAFKIGEAHYDLGNDLYQAMLDKRLTYTCGYWKDAQTLDEAQEAKLDLVCRKIGLKQGQKVLDIGCGWGSFAKFAAEKYGVEVVGITVSKEQVELARELCRGLPIVIKLQDYRDVKESFDHIVSLGMIEHVGYKNYRDYFGVVRRCLKDDGLFLLHTIGGNKSVHSTDPWIAKYIFPNSMLPSAKQLAEASEGLFVMEDWHNFSADYDKTLMAWYQNFESHWDQLKNKYDERFHRMWRFYLLACAGTFRSRMNQLWQIVYSKHGVPGGYAPVR